jgi:2-polyprenyl-3-methyl-5-hydroxy-6-metoxy-1,4-benzoquinol methylase
MAARQADVAARAVKPPRAMVWVVLLAMSGAVVAVGIVATGLVFAHLGSTPLAPRAFWARLLGACALTVVSLSVRSVRWIFLLRRAETRIPIRDAYIGYFAGLSLLFTPFLIGEITVRAYINRARGRVPVLTTTVVNGWERALDLVALGFIAGSAALAVGQRPLWAYVAVAGVFVSAVPLLRRLALHVLIACVAPIARRFDTKATPDLARLATGKAWWMGLAASGAAWVLPGLGLWLLAGEWRPALDLTSAELAYAHSAIVGGVLLAPGGVLITGTDMLSMLAVRGFGDTAAALTVLGVRLATVGLSMALGVVFVAIHLRSQSASSETHFDDIADAYDVQIPESRRLALLETKTTLMHEIIGSRAVGRRGLDVGCGQGAYVARMRALGLDVDGIDASPAQVQLATRNVEGENIVRVGSVLNIPGSNESYDFVYVINVLHHLGSLDEQRHAFRELFRIVKPGGVLFVHEINTQNVLFRFYMGYVFPSLNCIDEGVERWLRADRMAQYTEAPVVDVRYFTFLPDFIPQALVRVLGPIERLLEHSRLKVYSAHYMAVLEKPRQG